MTSTIGPVSRRGMFAGSLAILLSFAAGSALAGEPLRFAHPTWVGYGPLYIAQDKGFFKDEGVDVRLILMEDSKLRYAALAAGQVDAIATATGTMPLYLKPGLDFAFFGLFDDSHGGDGIVANKDIASITDLKGKRVAFEQGSISNFYLDVLLGRAGLSEKDIEPVNMTAGDAGSAFVTGNVDAAVTWEPWLSRGKKAAHGHLLVDTTTTPGLIMDVMVARSEMLAKRKADFAALMRAWYRGVEYMKAHPEESNEIMSKGLGGWLKDPKDFADVMTGVEIYDKGQSQAFFGTKDNPGQLYKVTADAIAIWSALGRLNVKPEPATLINDSVIGG